MNEHELRSALRGTVALIDPPKPLDTGPVLTVAHRARNRRRTRRAAGIAGALVLTVAAPVWLWPQASGQQPPTGDSGASASVRPTGSALAAKAVGVLERTVETPPRPGQWLYLESVESYDHPAKVLQVWLAVDGTRDGWATARPQNPSDPTKASYLVPEALLPGCVNGLVGVELRNNVPTQYLPCTPQPAYRTDLPTDAGALLSYLDKHGTIRDNPGEIARILDPIRDVLIFGYVPAATLAVLFEVVQRMPDLYVEGGVVDQLGRRAIAVGVRYGDRRQYRTEVLFDAVTYRYLGSRTLENGTVTTYSTLVRTAFVDAVRQTP